MKRKDVDGSKSQSRGSGKTVRALSDERAERTSTEQRLGLNDYEIRVLKYVLQIDLGQRGHVYRAR